MGSWPKSTKSTMLWLLQYPIKTVEQSCRKLPLNFWEIKIIQDVLFVLLLNEIDEVLIKLNLRLYWEKLKILTILTVSQSGWYSGRRSGFMVRVLDSRSSGPGLGLGRGHCVVFLGVVSSLAKKYEPAILNVCKETAENGEWSKEWGCAHNIAAKLLYNYAIFRENSQQETK